MRLLALYVTYAVFSISMVAYSPDLVQSILSIAMAAKVISSQLPTIKYVMSFVS